MSDSSDILISIAPTHTRAILSGRKTVELRRSRMHVESGTRVWIYSKVPVGSVEATAVVERVYQADPDAIWSQFQQSVGISRAAFDEYFSGCARGCAVVLREISPVSPALELARLKMKLGSFHPPQFFKRLRRDQIEILTGRSGARGSISHKVIEPRVTGASGHGQLNASRRGQS